MIGRVNHIALVVPDLEIAAKQYQSVLGATVTSPQDLADHGVTVVFVELPNTKIELMHPLGDTSPIGKFLDKNPDGGMHHICYEVEDISAACDQLVASGSRILGNGSPKMGSHGNPVVFLHPKDFCGTLIELEEIKSSV
ncbi:MAG: methylmalonyl-CoA epimerase [Granulosicoccus sp.]|nr:methylmalonyl-CoA epimerase [Granulosicoccus sp.]